MAAGFFLVGSIAPSVVVTDLLAAQPAHAEKGGKGGGGSGGGNAGAKGSGSGGSHGGNNGRGSERSAEARAAHSSSSHSVLGALNAYHASPKAFENASPNSRLGKLATYVEQRAAAHDTLTDRRKTVETRRTELAILQQNAAATAEQIARAQQALAAAELALAEIEAPLLATLELAANKMVTAAVWAEIDAELTQRGMLPAE